MSRNRPLKAILVHPIILLLMVSMGSAYPAYTGYAVEGDSAVAAEAASGDSTGIAESPQTSDESQQSGHTIYDIMASPTAFALSSDVDADGIKLVAEITKRRPVGSTKMASDLTTDDKNYIIIANFDSNSKEGTFTVKGGNLVFSGNAYVFSNLFHNYKEYRTQLSKGSVTTVNGMLPSECTDSDEGNNAYVAGETKGPMRGEITTITDSCSTQTAYGGRKQDVVVEGICNNGQMYTYQIVCINGCAGGACKEAEGVGKGQKCQDSDGGQDIYLAGEVTGTDRDGHTFRVNDVCIAYGGQQYVQEAYCYSSTMWTFGGAYCPKDYACNAEKSACVSTKACTPTTEVCDSKDNDCDTEVDEGGVCEQMPPVEDIVKKSRMIVIGASASTEDNIVALDIIQKYPNMYVTKDSEFQLGSQEVIIVGGPCVNTAAAKYMGFNKLTCGAASGIPSGGSILKVFKYVDRYALVVAGWGPAETRAAAKRI